MLHSVQMDIIKTLPVGNPLGAVKFAQLIVLHVTQVLIPVHHVLLY